MEQPALHVRHYTLSIPDRPGTLIKRRCWPSNLYISMGFFSVFLFVGMVVMRRELVHFDEAKTQHCFNCDAFLTPVSLQRADHPTSEQVSRETGEQRVVGDVWLMCLWVSLERDGGGSKSCLWLCCLRLSLMGRKYAEPPSHPSNAADMLPL